MTYPVFLAGLAAIFFAISGAVIWSTRNDLQDEHQ